MAEVGAMRHVIDIEQRSPVQDTAGEPILNWNFVMRRRAEVVRTPGREVFAAAERQARVPTQFRIRYPRAIVVLPSMRVVWQSRVYNILSAIDPDGLKVDMLITAEEWVEAQP